MNERNLSVDLKTLWGSGNALRRFQDKVLFFYAGEFYVAQEIGKRWKITGVYADEPDLKSQEVGERVLLPTPKPIWLQVWKGAK